MPMAKRNPLAHPEPQTMTFVRKSIRIGLYEIDGFMMPNGEFRQGLSSTGRAIGRDHKRVSKIVDHLLGPGANPLRRNESHAILAQKDPGSEKNGLQPILKLTGRPERLLSLELAQEVWAYEARYGEGDSQDCAWQILTALTSVSLERSFQEAFNVSDSRTQDQRLVDYFIDLNIGPYRRLFDEQFQIEFKRVALHDINSPSRHVGKIITELLYNRLPAEVTECIHDINPANEDGRRQVKFHQLLSQDAKAEVVKPIVATAKAFLMQAPAGGMREVYHNLDSVYPPQRGLRIAMGKRNFETRQMKMC
tara:strand:- start:405 stop:1325 length:921 start_codon:yes stop_codon:yes gene_type:complete